MDTKPISFHRYFYFTYNYVTPNQGHGTGFFFAQWHGMPPLVRIVELIESELGSSGYLDPSVIVSHIHEFADVEDYKAFKEGVDVVEKKEEVPQPELFELSTEERDFILNPPLGMVIQNTTINQVQVWAGVASRWVTKEVAESMGIPFWYDVEDWEARSKPIQPVYNPMSTTSLNSIAPLLKKGAKFMNSDTGKIVEWDGFHWTPVDEQF